MKALAGLVGPVPGHDQSIELRNLLLDTEQLSTECGKARMGNLRHAFVAREATICSSSVTPLCPTGATMPNSAK
jgi:hypothetical protein